MVALGLLGSGLYAGGVAAGADAQAPAPVVTPALPPLPESPAATPTPTPEPPTPTPTPTPEPPAPTPTPTATPDVAPPREGTPEANSTPPVATDSSPPDTSGRGRHGRSGRGNREEHTGRSDGGGEQSRGRKPRPRGPEGSNATQQAAGVPVISSLGAAQDLLIGSALPAPAIPGVFIRGFRIPLFLLPIYQQAAARYGVPWEVLAAINEIETDYGRNAHVSSAGAVGWMQFMPSTWKRYGVDANQDGVADPGNPIDAVFSAARYLRAAGAARDLRGAVFAYNHSDAYVDSVLGRARRIAGDPAGAVASLSGLAQGRFPVAARATYRDGRIFARAGAAVVAANDGRIIGVGRTRRGSFVRLEDVHGNTYTYARLKRLGQRRATGRATTVRLYAARRSHGIRITKLRPGARVVAGTVLGRIGRMPGGRHPHAVFRIRPAGRGAHTIAPGPILHGWRLLHAAGRLPSDGGNVWRLGTGALVSRVLSDPRVQIYDCGRRDIAAGEIDRRVLLTLEYLASSGLAPTVSALKCGHSLMTSSGNVSEHSTGSAVDISALNGIPIAGHQGPGSITDTAVRRLIGLQGEMRPHQIISLMQIPGAPNTLALPDHADHIHVGWRAARP